MLWLHGESDQARRSRCSVNLNLYKKFCELATNTIKLFRQVTRITFTSEKVIVAVGRAIDAFGSLIFLKILASTATKQDFGVYLLASSFLGIALTVSFSAFDQGLLRNISEYNNRNELASRYSAILVAYAALAVFLSFVAGVFLSITDIAKALQPTLIPLSFWLVCESIKNLNQTVASGLRSRTLIAVASAADYGCRILLLTWFAMDTNISPSNIITLLAVSGIASSAAYLVGQQSLLARFSLATIQSTLLDSIRFSWPLIIWGVFGWLQNMSNRWLLSHFVGLSTVAEYGVLVSIASFPVTILLGAVVTYVLPILYEQESSCKDSSRRVAKKAALKVVPIYGLMVLLTTVWHREFTTLLSGPEYTAHSGMLPIIMTAVCFSSVCSIFTYAVYAQRRVRSLLMANTFPGAFSLCFGYFAVRANQFEGALLTVIITNAVAGVLYVFSYMNSRPKPTHI